MIGPWVAPPLAMRCSRPPKSAEKTMRYGSTREATTRSPKRTPSSSAASRIGSAVGAIFSANTSAPGGDQQVAASARDLLGLLAPATRG